MQITEEPDFIRLSATKSLLTGKMYKIKCAENDLVTSKDWLNAELKVFRDTQAKQAEVKPVTPYKKPTS